MLRVTIGTTCIGILRRGSFENQWTWKSSVQCESASFFTDVSCLLDAFVSVSFEQPMHILWSLDGYGDFTNPNLVSASTGVNKRRGTKLDEVH